MVTTGYTTRDISRIATQYLGMLHMATIMLSCKLPSNVPIHMKFLPCHKIGKKRNPEKYVHASPVRIWRKTEDAD